MKIKITRAMLCSLLKIPSHARIKFVGGFWDEHFDGVAGIQIQAPDLTHTQRILKRHGKAKQA